MPSSILELWEKAIPLRDSIYRWGDRGTAETLREVNQRAPHPLTVLSEMVQKVSEGHDLSKGALLTPDEWPLQKSLRATLEKQIRGYLLRGSLVGMGYALPRRPADAPERVPIDLWQGFINWEQSKVSGNGLEFVVVRVIRPEVGQEFAAAPGRPSRRDQIVAAFKALDAEGLIDRTKPKARCYPMVRLRVLAMFPDQGETGLGKQALHTYISPLFDPE